MSDALEQILQGLRREYLSEAPERLAELRNDAAAFGVGEEGAAASLAGRFHRLAGSGGSYGFPGISEIARAMERRLRAAGDPPLVEEVEQAIEKLARAFDEARTSLPDSAD